MNYFEIFIIALALAADAFSVALVIGMNNKTSSKQVLRLAFIFGFFQFFMPLVGYFLLDNLQSFVQSYTHVVAFILLAIVGVKMFWEGLMDHGEDEQNNTVNDEHNDPTWGLTALSLALATSIDALAVGGTFASLQMSIFLPSIIIGVVCFFMTAIGMFISKKLLQKNSFLSRYANMLGGIILLAIGCKILFS